MTTERSLTKIIATVGPACSDSKTLRSLVGAGVSVFRLNFSHGSSSGHEDLVRRIRDLAARADAPIAILGDLRGPKIRISEVPEDGILLERGDEVVFERDRTVAGREGRTVRFGSTYKRLVDEVSEGERVLINDGAVRLLAVERATDSLRATVTYGGLVTSGKGINLPESMISAPALSEADASWVRWALDNELDFLALSFVRRPEDVRELRQLVSAASSPPALVAKIEHPAAVREIDGILNEADAIMVARGDLGVEMDLARVPVVQDQLIRAAHDHGRPVIIATQMLESMVHSVNPTRAEVTDIANAIFAEVDALMLSGETAVGAHPVLAVEHMRRTAVQAELYSATRQLAHAAPRLPQESQSRTAALAHGAWLLAQDFGAHFIVVWSEEGGGARMLSQNNFAIPIYAVSTRQAVLRRMQLCRGAQPIRMDAPADRDEFVRLILQRLSAEAAVRPGNRFVLMSGPVFGQARATDSISLHEVPAVR